MAENGLISKNTLTSIADAIRNKSQTTDAMIPEDMAPKIMNLKTGEVRYGTFIHTANSDTFNIGANVPNGDCVLMVMSIGSHEPNATNAIQQAWNITIDGSTTGNVHRGGTGSGVWTAIWVINHDTGDVSVDNSTGLLYFPLQYKYMWIYAGGGAV